MNSPVEAIKARVDVADLVGGYVKLHKAGVNLKGLCPFHQEKTPSFFVSPARQSWHCFGCNKGGDIFSFLQEVEGATFNEALKTLAQRAGVELKREPKETTDARERLFDANELAARFYEKQLAAGAAGKQALVYIAERGLLPETIGNFRLGWAPLSDIALTVFLKDSGFSEQDVVDAGLAIQTRRGLRDRFRGRIMFPIMDGNDRVVGFTGRIFGRDEGEYDPKYLNTPETPAFEKRRMLYGLNRARRAIRKSGQIVLVEGQMDCLMAHQAGTEEAVATSGTGLTEQHLEVMLRLADSLVIAYDADAAGRTSAVRGTASAITMAREQWLKGAFEKGFSVKLLIVEQGKDPADMIRENPEAWHTLLKEGTRPFIDFLIEEAVAEHGTDRPETKQRVAEAVLETLATMTNTVEQAAWISELAHRIRIREEALWEMLKKASSWKTSTVRDTAGAQPQAESTQLLANEVDRRELLEQHLLALLLLVPALPERTLDSLYRTPAHRELHVHVIGLFAYAPAQRLKTVVETVSEAQRSLAGIIALRAEGLLEVVGDLDKELKACIREVERHEMRERLEALSQDLRDAEERGDNPRVRDLTSQFRQHSTQLAALR